MNFKLLPTSLYYLLVLIIIITLIIVYTWYNLPLKIELSSFKYSVLSSFIGGLGLASLIFIMLRPSVAISSDIAKRINKETGEPYYSFKFINKSLFSAFDVNIEAYVCYEIGATQNGRGMNVKTKKVPLRRSNWIYLAKWKYVTDKTVHAPHCVIISTKTDIDNQETYVLNIKDEIESNSNYLEFRVTLKHAFSNLSSTYRKRYNTADCVKDGKFQFGNSLRII